MDTIIIDHISLDIFWYGPFPAKISLRPKPYSNRAGSKSRLIFVALAVAIAERKDPALLPAC